MSIDHETAKSVCHARLAQDMHPSSSDRNIARAYLDLHAQLEAKDRRIEALAELVERAYMDGLSEGQSLGLQGIDVHCESKWRTSGARQLVLSIMEDSQ